MNRNSQAHFANIPGIKIGRSKFDRAFTHKTTFSASELVPVFVDPDIVPGDSVTMRQSEIVRMMTPIAPVLDNCWLDFYWFFIPNRLVFKDFKKMMGENETAPWTQTPNVEIPQVRMQNNQRNTIDGESYITSNIVIGSVLEKMGIPPQENWTYASPATKQISISQLPTRAYCLVWNEFFRDENLENPVNIPITNNSSQLIGNKYWSEYINDPDAAQVQAAYLGGLPPLKVCKPHDYFTSCLPGAQKSSAVKIPLSDDQVEIKIGKEYVGDDPTAEEAWADVAATGKGLSFKSYSNDASYGEEVHFYKDTTEGVPQSWQSDGVYRMVADLTQVTGATVTQLRQAFAIQKFYERDARGGTRYIENVLSHFGVRNPDYRVQRPEYLGGFRHYINMNQVVQSNADSSDDTTPLGTTGAYSVTSGKNDSVFTKSFTEHGILMGLCCIRTAHTYQQGINRAWFKKKRLDFYSPEFASLSEQAVLNQEIYAQGTSKDQEAFGYQECWAEMRYMPDIISGELRSQYAQSLDIWHYGDYYDELPKLGDKWIKETDVNIQRTLAVQNHDQFMADFYFGAIYTRPMPLYSVPGLIDHH